MNEEQNIQKFLDFIGKAEGADYDIIVGGTAKNPKRFTDFSKHPRVVGIVTDRGPSTAAGRYQITAQTYDGFAKKLGITDFSPQSQDRIAIAIIQKEGALDDVKAGRFDAAIAKLGGRWESFPSSKTGNKRSPEWVAKELKIPLAARTPALQNTATNPTAIAPTQSVSQSDLLISDLQKEEKYGGFVNSITQIPQAISYGFQNENNAYNFFVEQGAAKADPNFTLTKEKFEAAYEGLPEDHKGYIAQAVSDDDLARRRGRVEAAVKRQEELGNMGGIGFAGTMVGTLLDVDTLLSTVPILGEGTMLYKAGRLGNALRTGLVAGATNAATEAAFGQYRPTATENDVYVAGLFGLGFGGTLGALKNPPKDGPPIPKAPGTETNEALAQWAQREAAKVQEREFTESGLTMTDFGKDLFNSYGKQEFDEATLSKVGISPNRSTSKPSQPDSIDYAQASYSELRALKETPSVGANIEKARVAITKAFGADILDGLENSGRIKFLNGQEDLPQSLRRDSGVNAFYDPITDTTFLLADRITKKNARGIIMHDVGVHQGLERIVGTPFYNRMIAEVDRLAAAGDSAAKRALARAEKSSTKDFLKNEEKLAYYMEAVGDKAQGMVREFIAKIKQFLINRFKMDLGLNQKDLAAIVQGSVKRVALDKKFGSYNKNFPYVWSGSPVKGIDKFSTDFVGTGEGNVNQGWGLYTTSSKFIGNWYREKEAMLRGLKGEDGGLYQLKVLNASPEQFLRWDSASQSKAVLQSLQKAGIKAEGKTGREIYFALMGKSDADTPLAKAKDVSEFLDSIGIRGNVYSTGNTKKKAVKSDNYVIFNDKNLDITQRFSEGDDIDPDLLPPRDANGNVPEGFWQGPAYENFFNRDWVPNDVKSFVRKIFGSTTGYKDHSVVEQSAMDQKRALAGQWTNQFAKTIQPAIREFLEDMQVPFMKRSEALEKWNEDLGDYIRGVPGDYHPTIIKSGNEWRRLSKDVVDHINNPGKFNGDIKRGLTQREIADDQGNTTMTDPLAYNENYLPRIPDTYKIANMISQFGRETVENFIGKMFKSANNDLDEDMVPKLGKWYLATIEEAKVNRAADLIDNQLRGFDDVGFKDSLIKVAGVTAEQADRIISGMRPKKGSDAGMLNGNLKRRSLLDETYTQKLMMKNGDTHEMSYKDLFDTDTVGNINQYFTKQAGAISLANHTGMYNVKDVKKAIAEMTGREFGDQVNDEQLAKMRKHLQDILDQTLSRPLEDFSTFNKSLQMVADYNVLTKAGLFVLNQITELSQILGSPMYKSVLRSVPELNKLIRDAKTGKVNNETIDALENLSGGPGTQLLRDNPLTPTRTWVREKGDTKFNQWLDSADNTLKRGTHNLFKFTGMTGVTMMQQRMVATAFVNHMVDHAVNGKNIGYSADRLAWMGLSDVDTKAVMDGIRTYHKAGEGRLGTVDFNTWAKEDPKTFSKFIVAYQRESARIVQENDLASMVPIMGRSVGQVLFQFMGFPLQAWNKSMLFAANHMDTHTLNTVMYAIGMNMLMYTARVQMTMAGMSDTEKRKYAEERLSSQKIILNAVGRIPQLSVLPNMFDTVSPVPLFSGMRTTTDLTDFVSGNPTISTISGFLNMGKKVVRNSASDEYQTTEKDVRTWMRLAPLNNVMGVSNILNSVAADYPSQEKQSDE